MLPFIKLCVLFILTHSPLKVPLKINFTAIHVLDLPRICVLIIKSKIVQGLKLKYLTFRTLVKNFNTVFSMIAH